jgi:predicted Zn-dependent peptidase
VRRAIPIRTGARPAPPANPVSAVNPAPVADLVEAVDIPYERFSLPNGLTVLVHTDRKAPVVAVSVWYKIGSKHEPRGKTGFAHLFEHMMFQGSMNLPKGEFDPHGVDPKRPRAGQLPAQVLETLPKPEAAKSQTAPAASEENA